MWSGAATVANGKALHSRSGGRTGGVDHSRTGVVLVSMLLSVLAQVDLLGDIEQGRIGEGIREWQINIPWPVVSDNGECDQRALTLHVDRGLGTGDS